jgi:tetratricopeptide (TPR) repeat protein
MTRAARAPSAAGKGRLAVNGHMRKELRIGRHGILLSDVACFNQILRSSCTQFRSVLDGLTRGKNSGSFFQSAMVPRNKNAKRRSSQPSVHRTGKILKTKELDASLATARLKAQEVFDQATQLQLKVYEEALGLFQLQKFNRARPLFLRVLEGMNKELGDRARMHLHICEQRMERYAAPQLRSAEDHYTHGVALMNLGRWDEAREHLDRAHKSAPKADHIIYAMAALDCLCGESESAMKNLAIAMQIRPENRYLARNDPDFAFLQDDPRFTELLYPERDSVSG